MMYLIHFILGWVTSYIGSMTPSMLNMTTAKIRISYGKKSALNFALGVSFVVLLQSYIAILFTKYLRSNPVFVEYLQMIALVIFFALSFYFYSQFKKEQDPSKNGRVEKNKNSFAVGLLLSALNMFSIPFYCGVTTALDAVGWFSFSKPYIASFVLGSAFGTFMLLYTYLFYAKIIQEKAKGLAKNLNLILALLTFILAITSLLKIVI